MSGAEQEQKTSSAASRPVSLLSPLAGNGQAEGVRGFGFMRSLGFVAMGLALILSIVLTTYLGNTASKTLFAKNHNFSALLGDYLNNQIYRRFTLPTISIFGRIALRNPDQYKALDQIIHSIIQGLHVDDVRIFAHDNTIAYSTNAEELGSADYATPSITTAFTSSGPIFDIDAKIPYWQAFFKIALEKDTFRMRTTYPLRVENRLSSTETETEGPLMGVLEFSQDVTRDIKNAIRFQQLTLAATLLGSGMLMAVLLLLVRRAERALAARVSKEQRLLLELHQHEKLASMGRVVASIAHEIRNPLGIISSSAELLMKKAEGANKGTGRILEAIYDEAKRLSRTVSDFLDYARPRPPKQDPVNVSALITQALAFLSSELSEREIGVVRAGDLDSPLWVAGDSHLLYRAFYNILSNGIQAIGKAGTLTISHAYAEDNPFMVALLFHDSGPGFPEEHKDQLLDPFFTTKDDGTGLGLPIVQTIIASHGGTLRLANAQSSGAEVLILLPKANAPTS